jgi:hypothetical protein
MVTSCLGATGRLGGSGAILILLGPLLQTVRETATLHGYEKQQKETKRHEEQ